MGFDYNQLAVKRKSFNLDSTIINRKYLIIFVLFVRRNMHKGKVNLLAKKRTCLNNVKLSLIYTDKVVYIVSKFVCLVSLGCNI